MKLVAVILLLVSGAGLQARPFKLHLYHAVFGETNEIHFGLGYPAFKEFIIAPALTGRTYRTLDLELPTEHVWVYNSSSGWVAHDVTGQESALLRIELVSGVTRQVFYPGTVAPSGGGVPDWAWGFAVGAFVLWCLVAGYTAHRSGVSS